MDECPEHLPEWFEDSPQHEKHSAWGQLQPFGRFLAMSLILFRPRFFLHLGRCPLHHHQRIDGLPRGRAVCLIIDGHQRRFPTAADNAARLMLARAHREGVDKSAECMAEDAMRRFEDAQLVECDIKPNPPMLWVYLHLCVCHTLRNTMRNHLPEAVLVHRIILPGALVIVLHFLVVAPIAREVDLDKQAPLVDIGPPCHEQLQAALSVPHCISRRAPMQESQSVRHIRNDALAKAPHVTCAC